MDNTDLELFARCASGFESVLAQELKRLRLRRVRPLRGGVAFFGTLQDAYRACLWTRVATRVQLVLCRVPARNAQELYRGVESFPWERHIPASVTVSVDAHGENPQLRNTKFTALKVKDALCDRLRRVRGERPNVDARHADFAVDVALHQSKATVYLNLSGESLHRRGYRADGVQSEAPLKETLAAGLLLAAGWPALARRGGMLVDPMCGSGTLAIEGALIAANIAPGILRTTWGFMGWLGHDPLLWAETLVDAREQGTPERAATVLAGDLNPQVVDLARANARRAGVADLVRFYVDDAARLARHLRSADATGATGLLATNPPYGHRLLSPADLAQVDEALVAATDALPAGWQVALITPDTGVDTALGRAPRTVLDCYNGPIRACVRVYDADASRRQVTSVVSLAGVQRSVPLAEAGSAQFAARLRKVAKERARWSRKAGVSCYRVYDADLPDYALSVDLYRGVEEGAPACAAVVAERRRPGSVDGHRADRRLADAAALVSAVLDVPVARVLARAGVADKSARGGAGQDERRPLTVEEGGHEFAIDLAGKPDTGLPLQLRGVRALVGEMAAGARFADLSGAAGAAAVYAAAGGAAGTTCVEPYHDRLERARQVMRANGFGGAEHRFARVDVRAWLEGEQRARHRYDLVLCAVPGGGQADKTTGLLREVAQVLSERGVAVCVCQGRSAKLDARALERDGLRMEDVSERVLQSDFARGGGALGCYLVRETGDGAAKGDSPF